MNSYEKLLESFKSNFENDESQMIHFQPWFEKIASKISSWDFEDCFVDVGKVRGIIDFNICFKNGLWMSIEKVICDDSNEIFFAMAKNHRTFIIDKADLDELISICSKLYG